MGVTWLSFSFALVKIEIRVLLSKYSFKVMHNSQI